MKGISACVLFMGLSVLSAVSQIATEDAFVTIENETYINTDELEFSPAFYKNGIVFVSSQSTTSTLGPQDRQQQFLSLFQATRNAADELHDSSPFGEELKSDAHEGPLSFNQTGTKVYFTRNEETNVGKKKKEDGEPVRYLKIYSAELLSGQWSNVQELSFNEEDSNAAHPTISIDGNTLYFASDREGGQGGMDIYKVEKSGDSWGTPVNLGSNVNSSGREAFPFIHADGTLYYASDELDGNQGGLDIYYSVPLGDDWAAAKHLSGGFNTEGDDFGLIVDLANKNGYFTSSRLGGQGNDDIYRFTVEGGKEPPKNDLTVKVIDQYGSEIEDATITYAHLDELRISSAATSAQPGLNTLILQKVSNDNPVFLLRAESEPKIPAVSTDSEGKANVKIRTGSYVLKASKPGYLSDQVTFEAPISGNMVLLTLNPPVNCVPVEGMIASGNNAPRPGIRVVVKDLSTGREEQVMSGPDGTFDYCLECGRQYEFYPVNNPARKEIISTLDQPCDQELAVNLTFDQDGASGNDYASNDGNGYQNGGNYNNDGSYNGNNDGSGYNGPINFGEGSIISLDKIYYNFDDASLRQEAREQLDLVVQLLMQDLQMVIQLNSHTDSRGSNAYNMDLSQRRADNAVDYLVNNGIDPARIESNGLGEEQLVNECYDGMPCTEAQHQQNRRTEVVILEIGNSELLSQNPLLTSLEDLRPKWGEDAYPVEASPIPLADFAAQPVSYEQPQPVRRTYSVIAGTFSINQNAQNQLQRIKRLGYSQAYIQQTGDGLEAIHVDQFEDKYSAEQLQITLEEEQNVEAYIKIEKF